MARLPRNFCVRCGKLTNRTKYCSKECMNIARRHPVEIKYCLQCGKILVPIHWENGTKESPAQFHHRKFCNRAEYNEYRATHPPNFTFNGGNHE